MALLEKYLSVRKSNLPGAGKGLFTKVDIPKGSRIVEYKGRIQTWKEVKDQDGYNGYLLRINWQTVVNALPRKKALARYANDARGLTRRKGLTNNAEYVTEGRKCYIEAKRSIGKDEEILVSYGIEFWNLIRKIRKESK
jgi:SET domain-containing protein